MKKTRQNRCAAKANKRNGTTLFRVVFMLILYLSA